MTEVLRDEVPGDLTYSCAPGVKWAVESYGIILFHSETGVACKLGYPQAEIWNLISLGYSSLQIIQMLCAITSCDHSEATRLVLINLDSWSKAGFLVRKVSPWLI